MKQDMIMIKELTEALREAKNYMNMHDIYRNECRKYQKLIMSAEIHTFKWDSKEKDICECGNTADGTLYDKPMCERCLYYALK